MSIKYCLVFLAILTTILALRLLDLAHRVHGGGAAKATARQCLLPRVHRTPVPVPADYPNLFGTGKSSAPGTAARKVAGKPSPTEMNELIVNGDEIIRVQGIFITADERYAILETSHRSGKHQRETWKVHPGEQVKQYTVSKIAAGVITLEPPGNGNIIQLRIFKPLEK
ncbi:MAG: hypothetical protein DRH04_00065 [Deltaproteobacteria bacterium]|nr:MAG: hypothetical protein DRH04_00065 [Deltaproteobacteria bacterium]